MKIEAEQQGDSFMLVTYGESSEEISIVRLGYSPETDGWKPSLEGSVTQGAGAFVNAFHLAGD